MDVPDAPPEGNQENSEPAGAVRDEPPLEGDHGEFVPEQNSALSDVTYSQIETTAFNPKMKSPVQDAPLTAHHREKKLRLDPHEGNDLINRAKMKCNGKRIRRLKPKSCLKHKSPTPSNPNLVGVPKELKGVFGEQKPEIGININENDERENQSPHGDGKDNEINNEKNRNGECTGKEKTNGKNENVKNDGEFEKKDMDGRRPSDAKQFDRRPSDAKQFDRRLSDAGAGMKVPTECDLPGEQQKPAEVSQDAVGEREIFFETLEMALENAAKDDADSDESKESKKKHFKSKKLAQNKANSDDNHHPDKGRANKMKNTGDGEKPKYNKSQRFKPKGMKRHKSVPHINMPDTEREQSPHKKKNIKEKTHGDEKRYAKQSKRAPKPVNKKSVRSPHASHEKKSKRLPKQHRKPSVSPLETTQRKPKTKKSKPKVAKSGRYSPRH